MEFDWDPMKDTQNRRKHGFPLEFAPLIFEGRLIEEEDRRREYGETRFIATGPIAEFGGRICVVVYAWRESTRRIISFRKANDREIRKYRAHHA